MTEQELCKFYGADYKPPSDETTTSLLADEQIWAENNIEDDTRYNYRYAVFGARRNNYGKDTSRG